jgi:hypothetical protein
MAFRAGDHLCDHRRRFGVPYTHHAIKVHDEQVIEFGGSTVNKAAMGIACAPYERFATGRRVDVVRHDAHDAELSIRRAEWLLSCPPTRRAVRIDFGWLHKVPANGTFLTWRAGALDVCLRFCPSPAHCGKPSKCGPLSTASHASFGTGALIVDIRAFDR